MSRPAVIVPFKGGRYKSRLSPVLDAGQRREFAYLLLADLLGTLKEAGLRRQTYVVSSDEKAAQQAKEARVSFIPEPRASGVNSAVRAGAKRLKSARFMVIPSDLALLSPADLHCALEIARSLDVVIAPSKAFNGTNLLVFPRKMLPRLSYDNDSFWNHLAGAAKLGLTVAVLTKRGLIFDVDTPNEARELRDLRINKAASRFLRKSLGK